MSDGGGEEDLEAVNNEEGGGGDREGGTYTETEYESFGDRLQGACAGICIGIILFFASFPLLFWNETRAVERYDALNEAEAQVMSISGMDIDPANEGQLLHFTTNVTNGGGTLIDPIFGIQSEGLKLQRHAEMYQWVEKKRSKKVNKVGGGKTTRTTYTYEKEWVDYVVDSQYFKQGNHTNPSYMEFESETVIADPIMIGAYELPQELVGRVDRYSEMDVDIENITDESIRGRARKTPDGFYFKTANSSSTWQVGDQRVQFSETPELVFTVVGVQNGNTLAAFVSETGEGGDVLLFKEGNYSATAMFDEAEAENAFLTWILRFVGFILMTLGIYLVFRPIEVFADVIPCVGSIVGCGIIFMAVVIAAILSAITISVAWLVAHPEIGAIVLGSTLAVIGCCAFGVKQLRKNNGGKNDDGSSSPSSHGKIETTTMPVANATGPPPTVYASAEPTTVYATGAPPTAYASAPTPTSYASAPTPTAYASAPPTVYAMPQGQVVTGGAPQPTVYSTPGPYVPNT